MLRRRSAAVVALYLREIAYSRPVQRRADGWYLTFAGLGAPGVRGDEVAARIPKLTEVQPSPLQKPGWVRRSFQRTLDLTHQGARIHLVLLAYGLDEGASVDTVPLKNVDGVLLFTTGDKRTDDVASLAVARILAARTGSPPPPALVEIHPASDDTRLGKHFRALARRAIDALQAGQLPDSGVRGALTVDRIREMPREKLVTGLVDLWAERKARARARATGEVVMPVPPPAWAELLAIVEVEIQVADSGLAAIFDRPERRVVEPDAVRLAQATYARLGLGTKAAVLGEAIAVAEAGELWSSSRAAASLGEEAAYARLDELAVRFEADGSREVQERLAADVLARPEAFELPAELV